MFVCGERTAFKLCDSNYIISGRSKYWAPINIIYYVKRASWTHNRNCWQMAGYICRELSLGLCIGWFDGGARGGHERELAAGDVSTHVYIWLLMGSGAGA